MTQGLMLLIRCSDIELGAPQPLRSKAHLQPSWSKAHSLALHPAQFPHTSLCRDLTVDLSLSRLALTDSKLHVVWKV